MARGEEFRSPLTDRFTLRMINNRIFDEQDFYQHTASGGVYLRQEPRKRYFSEYEKFITRPMSRSSVEEDEIDFRRLFRHLAERLKKAITKGENYCPYHFHW